MYATWHLKLPVAQLGKSVPIEVFTLVIQPLVPSSVAVAVLIVALVVATDVVVVVVVVEVLVLLLVVESELEFVAQWSTATKARANVHSCAVFIPGKCPRQTKPDTFFEDWLRPMPGIKILPYCHSRESGNP